MSYVAVPKDLRDQAMHYFERDFRSPVQLMNFLVQDLPDNLTAELKLRLWHQALYMQNGNRVS